MILFIMDDETHLYSTLERTTSKTCVYAISINIMAWREIWLTPKQYVHTDCQKFDDIFHTSYLIILIFVDLKLQFK